MVKNEKVIQALFEAVDEFNQQLSEGQRLKKSRDTCLYGKAGILDSLALVTFIVTTEQKLEEEFGITLTLADDRALSQRNSIFRTIGTLADYTSILLEERLNGPSASYAHHRDP